MLIQISGLVEGKKVVHQKKCNPKNIGKSNETNSELQAERVIMLDNISMYIGKWYKIEYESLSKDGIPTKPVGIGLRDCDINGSPLI